MDKDILAKINEVFQKGDRMTEHELRSVMILIRKLLELMSDQDKLPYLLLVLFCNWAAHTEITKSNTGLRLLAKVNDALVGSRHSGDGLQIGLRMSEALSFSDLRKELVEFLTQNGLETAIIRDDRTWATCFLAHLIEVIRDVPLAFPTQLDVAKQKIYDSIAQNALKPGAGVISLRLSRVDYDKIGAKGIGERLCVLVTMADTTTIVIPLAIDARL